MLPYNKTSWTADERETLVGILNEQRAVILWKLQDLDEASARQSMVPSGTSLLGLVKHLAWVERWWFVDFIGGGDVDYPWSKGDPDADFRVEPDDSIASVSQLYIDAVGEANAVIAGASNLDVVGTLESGQRSLRWVLVHMIDETGRHAGHADILRELIDGATGYYPQG